MSATLPTQQRLLPTLLARASALNERFPWAIPAASFVAGWVGFVLVKRGEDLARIVALMAVAGWLWLLAEKPAAKLMDRLSGGRLPHALLHMVSQSLQQEILFFALPFFIGMTQRDPGQLLFTGLLIGASMLSTLDHWYGRHIARHPVWTLVFHAYCCFVAGLVALPVTLHLSLERTVPAALAMVGVWLLASLPWRLRSLSREQRIQALAVILAAPALVWAIRAHIPAAGLSVVDARISQTVEARVPGPEARVLTVAQLRAGGAAAFVSIRAPMGLSQSVIFDWYHRGKRVDRISAEIRGSGRGGWRTYTRKSNFPDNPEGRWHVDLRTPQGQLIKRLHFLVVPADQSWKVDRDLARPDKPIRLPDDGSQSPADERAPPEETPGAQPDTEAATPERDTPAIDVPAPPAPPAATARVPGAATPAEAGTAEDSTAGSATETPPQKSPGDQPGP